MVKGKWTRMCLILAYGCTSWLTSLCRALRRLAHRTTYARMVHIGTCLLPVPFSVFNPMEPGPAGAADRIITNCTSFGEHITDRYRALRRLSIRVFE